MLLEQLDREFPGVLDFYDRLLKGYFLCGPRDSPEMAARMSDALQTLGVERARECLREFERAGVLREGRMSSDDQVRLFWTSPLTQAWRAAVGYQPSRQDNVREWLPQPARNVSELLARQAGANERARSAGFGGGAQYWQWVLQHGAPELYLEPFLAGRRGLDLGCGWGRATLSIPSLTERQMVGVDLNREELDLFEQLARNAGTRVELLCTDASALPFEQDRFDFVVSYVFLDLLSDDALERCLQEVLRVTKPPAPFYVEVPVGHFVPEMMLQELEAEDFLNRLHRVRYQNRSFQVALYDTRSPTHFTFAILENAPFQQPGLRHARAAQRILYSAVASASSSSL